MSRRRKSRRSADPSRRGNDERVEPKAPSRPFAGWGRVLALAVSVAAIWSYFPNCQRLVQAWEEQPDYSHGYLVLPLAALICWSRRDSLPRLSGPEWVGVTLLLGAFLMRTFGAALLRRCGGRLVAGVRRRRDRMDLGGMASVALGVARRCLLFFMIPLPYRGERALSYPLQTIATHVSEAMLQCLGQPAVAEGNVIWIGRQSLEVAEACSGLRIFVGVAALAYVWAAISKRGWLDRILVVLSVPVVAVLANSIRITATGLLYQYWTSEAAQRFNHDLAGWLVLPLAAGAFFAFSWYLGRVFPDDLSDRTRAWREDGARWKAFWTTFKRPLISVAVTPHPRTSSTASSCHVMPSRRKMYVASSSR